MLDRELFNYEQLMLCQGATLWLICGELERKKQEPGK